MTLPAAEPSALRAVPDALNPPSLEESDPDVSEAIAREIDRQRGGLELIASENFVSRAVLEATGSVMTNKYAEGYPGRRYYGGCDCVDVVEELACSRARELFGADHANVQTHSGSGANMAALHTLADPGATIMGMELSHGGHLTHGSRVNFSGIWYDVVSYGVSESDRLIDYDALRKTALEVRPQVIIAGASAYPRIIDFERFAEIAKECGARLLVDMAHIAGLVATGHHPSPIPHADVVTSTTHKTLRGPRGGLVLCREEYAAAIDKAVFPGLQGGPLMHVIAAKAVALREALQPSFRDYSERVVRNARALAAALAERGCDIVSGGTDTHIVLVDLRSIDLTGKRAEELLGRAGVTVNKNTVPFDTRSPFVTSGIRIGTAAVSTRSMGEPEMWRIAGLVDRALRSDGDEAVLATVRAGVEAMCNDFPLYSELAARDDSLPFGAGS